MSRGAMAGVLALLLIKAAPVLASGTLLYLESQGVAGYSSAENNAIFYSMHEEDSMQKPSAGFDYIQKFSGESGDIATLAVQIRAAFDRKRSNAIYIEPQLYNAYVKFKTPAFDIWIGHDRPALGLSSYFDSHGLLLPTLAMVGFGFDRDWGGGLYRQFDFGDMSVSATTGSGMPVYFKGSYFTSARIGVGVLSRDNYTIGFSGGYGRLLDTKGINIMSRDLYTFGMGGIDYAQLWNNFEFRIDALAGKKEGEFAVAAMFRVGINLLEEDRLKIEIQPVYWRTGHENNYQAYGSVSYAITEYLTVRSMYVYDYHANDHKVVGQLYFYWRV
ncbi:MAG TPA: hypothetical protein PL180_06965 [Spirochaetota bacterium]|nr:hypothetical protein [Spirochaetota bacterium]HRS76439.1 hypothetical protein [Spirochaetota bacterium]